MERMIKEIYKNIFGKENLYDLSVFIKEYQDYEEIPLVSRYKHLSFLNDCINREDLQYFLTNTAVFLMNCINLYASKKLSKEEFDNFFACITFGDEDEVESGHFYIPNILVTRKIELFKFLSNYSDKIDSEEIASAFVRIGIRNTYKYCRTVNQDELCGELVCVYAIDPANRLKIDNLKNK